LKKPLCVVAGPRIGITLYAFFALVFGKEPTILDYGYDNDNRFADNDNET